MVKPSRGFILSVAGAIAWLALSALLARPWVRQAALSLPLGYTVWVVAGIALLPGYLMCAMFLSNSLYQAPPAPVNGSCLQPVTVLVCARNEAKSIYHTLQSIASQRYGGPICILCVDNGSSDQTWDEMARAAADFQGPGRTIRLLFCPTPGKTYALNQGLEHIQTPYFLTVDGDTQLKSTAVAALMDKMVSGKAACVAGNLLVAQTNTWVQKMQLYDYLLAIAAVKRYQGSYGATLVAQGALSAYETQAVRAVGGWTQGVGEDIVLTYRLLASGRKSLYQPLAVGYTQVPATLKALCSQRSRWAQGLFEGLRAVKPWQQPSLYGGYFQALSLSVVYLDLAYVFGFLAGVALALAGLPYFVGWLTLLLLPGVLVTLAGTYRFQKHIPMVSFHNSWTGFFGFLLLFQPIQSICSLWGYARALTGRAPAWKQ